MNIILWLRKNELAKDIRNEPLGKKIYDIITELGGEKIGNYKDSFWDTHILPKLYEKLMEIK